MGPFTGPEFYHNFIQVILKQEYYHIPKVFNKWIKNLFDYRMEVLIQNHYLLVYLVLSGKNEQLKTDKRYNQSILVIDFQEYC